MRGAAALPTMNGREPPPLALDPDAFELSRPSTALSARAAPGAAGLPALEADVEKAIRAQGACSPALQRSASTAAGSRAEALLQRIAELVEAEVPFVQLENTSRALAPEFVRLLEQNVPRGRKLAQAAGLPLESWDESLRQEVMLAYSNSPTSQYVGPGNVSDWPQVKAAGFEVDSISFQLARSGLVSFTLSLAARAGAEPCARLQGEGVWELRSMDDGLGEVVLRMQQGLSGVMLGTPRVGVGSLMEPARSITLKLQEFRRVTLDGAEISEDEDDEEEEEGDC